MDRYQANFLILLNSKYMYMIETVIKNECAIHVYLLYVLGPFGA